MNEPFDEASARRPGFVFVFTVTAAFTFVAGLVWAIVALVFNSGPWICSESGDDLVSRPSAAAYLPEIAVCVIAVLLLAAMLQAAVGLRWAVALAASSTGSILSYLTLAHYLSHANEPATYDCGSYYLYPAVGMPAYAAPMLLAVYVLVVLSCRSSRKRGRGAAA